MHKLNKEQQLNLSRQLVQIYNVGVEDGTPGTEKRPDFSDDDVVSNVMNLMKLGRVSAYALSDCGELLFDHKMNLEIRAELDRLLGDCEMGPHHLDRKIIEKLTEMVDDWSYDGTYATFRYAPGLSITWSRHYGFESPHEVALVLAGGYE